MKVDQDNGKYHIMAEINMIPFIDVVLVLLIIFMVITPILVRSQIKINIPSSKSVDNSESKEKLTEVKVQKDGALFVEGQRVTADEIEQVLKRQIADPDKHAVVIEADKNVMFQHVVSVMGAAKKLNITRIAVRVIEEKKPESRK